MSTRPGTPESVTDILTEILAELRAINAKLGQDSTATIDLYAAVGDGISEIIEEMADFRGGIVV